MKSLKDESGAFGVPRPNLPPLLVGALVFWFGALVAWQGMFSLLCLCALSAVLFAAYAIGRLRFARRWTLLLVCSCSLLLGLACGSLHQTELDAQRDSVLEQGALAEAQALVLSDSTQGDYGSQCKALVRIGAKAYRLQLSFADATQLYFGDSLLVSGKLSVPSDFSYLDELGVAAKLSVKDCTQLQSSGLAGLVGSWRRDQIGRVCDSFDQLESLLQRTFACAGAPSGGVAESSTLLIAGAIPLDEIKSLILALGFGFRPSLSSSLVYADFKLAGLAHLVAVSGAHLALVTGFALVVLRRIGVAVKPLCCAVFGFLILYVFMVGVPVSCLRAAVMAALSLLSSLSERRASSISALGMVIALFIAFDPTCASSVSFQLSVLATLGIVLFSPWLVWWFSALRLPRFVLDSLAVTLSATVPTLPLTICLFSQVPLVSPVANLLAGPFLSIVMACCLVLVPLSIVPNLMNVVMAALLGVLGLFALVVHGLVTLPFACVPLTLQPGVAFALGFISCAAWWICWPAPGFRNAAILVSSCLALTLCVFLVAGGFRLVFHGDDLVMLDVGQGDAFLLESEGKKLLIDTGRSDSKLLKGLASEGVVHLDGVLITHCDDDHYGSLDALRGIVGVDSVYAAKGMSQLDNAKAQEIESVSVELTGRKACELSLGAKLDVGDFSLEVVSPEALVDGGNQDSLTLIASVEKGGKTWKTLLCGDAESETLEMLDCKDQLCDIDVLKVGHHGSRVSVSESLLETLKPEVALISVGARNRYGHPTEEALDALDESGAQVFRTDESGKVICSFGDKGLELSCVG